jgi:hypothetical protein
MPGQSTDFFNVTNLNYNISKTFGPEFDQFIFNTVILSFLKRERERFRLFVPKRYSVTTRKFLSVPDRSPFLTVTMTVPDRFWPFMTISGRS